MLKKLHQLVAGLILVLKAFISDAHPAEEPKWTLERLLAGISSENIHREIDTGEAVGREYW